MMDISGMGPKELTLLNLKYGQCAWRQGRLCHPLSATTGETCEEGLAALWQTANFTSSMHLLLNKVTQTRLKNIRKVINIGIADQQNSGKQGMIKRFSIQPYPSTWAKDVGWGCMPPCFPALCCLSSLHLVTFVMFFSLVTIMHPFMFNILYQPKLTGKSQKWEKNLIRLS